MAALGGTGGPGTHPQSKGDVLEDGQMAEQRVVLEGKPGLALAGGQVRDVLAVEQHLAGSGIGKFQPGDDAQQRGLARAGRTEQGDEFAGFDLQAHVVQGGEASKLLGDVADFDAHEAVVQLVGGAVALCFHSTQVFRARVTSASSVSSEATANAPTKLYSL